MSRRDGRGDGARARIDKNALKSIHLARLIRKYIKAYQSERWPVVRIENGFDCFGLENLNRSKPGWLLGIAVSDDEHSTRPSQQCPIPQPPHSGQGG